MHSRRALPAGFLLVFWRECRWLLRRPFLLALTTVVPAAMAAVLTAIFSAGLATKLPVGVLDLDGSQLSRTIVRMVDGTPDVAVSVPFADLAEGRQAILSGRIHGLLMLPRDLERDVSAGRRPEVVFFYNTQMLTTGNLVLRGINAAVPSAAAGIRLNLRNAQGQPVAAAQESLQPVPVQTHALFNPTLNYVHFLLAALLPAILQITVVTGTSYSAGLDLGTPHRVRILGRLGGGLWPAMFGKILPYTLIHIALLMSMDIVLFGFFGLPLRGSMTALGLVGVLFILSCQFIGLLLALLLRPAASAVSIGTLVTAPAFGFMGIGFPRLGMGAFAYGWGAILPGTWYLDARIDQTVRGTPLDLSARPILILAVFVTAFAILSALVIEYRRERADRERVSSSGPAQGVTQ